MQLKIRALVLFFCLGITFAAHGQLVANNDFLRELTMALSDYRIGSGFTFIIFKTTNTSSEKISITSSNFRTKRIIDSVIEKNKDGFLKIATKRKGYYALPIIQIMDDESKDRLIWDNNTFYEMMSFKKGFELPKNTILMKPLVIVGWPPIVN